MFSTRDLFLGGSLVGGTGFLFQSGFDYEQPPEDRLFRGLGVTALSGVAAVGAARASSLFAKKPVWSGIWSASRFAGSIARTSPLGTAGVVTGLAGTGLLLSADPSPTTAAEGLTATGLLAFAGLAGDRFVPRTARWLGQRWKGRLADYFHIARANYAAIERKALASGSSGLGAMLRGSRAYMTPGVMAIAGGILGATYADDSATGAVLGAGGGLVAGGLIQSGKTMVRIAGNPLGKAGLFAAAMAAGGVAGALTAPQEAAVKAVAVDDGTGGYEAIPEEYVGYSGISGRMRSINATGDLVFGLHNRRHGY